MSYRQNKGFNRRQQALYRPMVKRAWLEHCQKHGIFPNAKGQQDQWYRNELMECIGENTTSRCNKSQDFDIVMRHFSVIAKNEQWPVKISDSPERRYRFLIEQRLEQMRESSGSLYTWKYALGILKHMFPNSPFVGDMADCPAAILRKVFIALDRQAARLRSRNARQDKVPF